MQINTTSSIPQTPAGKTSKEEGLRNLSRQFESMFSSYLLKSMNKTIDRSDGLFEYGMEQEYYQEMLMDEYSQKISNTGNGLGLSEMIYKSLLQTYGGDEDKSVADLSQALNKVQADKSKDYMKYQTGLGGVPASELYKMYQTGDLSGKNIDRYLPLIQSAADTYQLDPNLIKSIILHESSGNSQAVSAKGAKGLMQLMDSTADSLGVTNSLDPAQNIQGGSRYLRQLLDTYQGDESLALAAYNAGPNNVAKYAGIPPFPETVNYVKNVLEGKKQFNQPEIKQ